MDLALEFGMPMEELKRRMTERELGQWARRAQRHWLPARRMEWYLARIALVVAASFGGNKDAAIEDFLLELEPQQPSKRADADEAREFFGFSPRNKKA